MTKDEDLPAELPANPEGWRKQMTMHLNFGAKGAAATFAIIDAEGRTMPFVFSYRTGKGHRTEERGFYLEGSKEPLTWVDLRKRWPTFLKLRRRVAAARAAGKQDGTPLADDKPMMMYVVYDNPKDLPGGFVVRLWATSPSKITPCKVVAQDLPSLEEARKHIPDGLVNIGRTDDDDPVITEVWL